MCRRSSTPSPCLDTRTFAPSGPTPRLSTADDTPALAVVLADGTLDGLSQSDRALLAEVTATDGCGVWVGAVTSTACATPRATTVLDTAPRETVAVRDDATPSHLSNPEGGFMSPLHTPTAGTVPPTADPVFYEETIHMREPWLWGFLGISGFVTTFLVAAVVVSDADTLAAAVGQTVQIAVVLFAVALPYAVLWRARLEVTVGADGVTYRFFPFQLSRRRLAPAEIDRVETAAPTATMGRGIRRGDDGPEYLANGGDGLRLYAADRKPVFVESTDPAAFRRAVERLLDER